MTPDSLLWGVFGTLGVSFLTMFLTRVAAIAAARRSSYAIIAAKMVELWQEDVPDRRRMLIELTKLVVDGNRDLDAHIERFVNSMSEEALLQLLVQMRATAFLANVRESFLGSGPSRSDLLAKLLSK